MSAPESREQAEKPRGLHSLVLARSTIDRAGEVRADSARLEALWREGKILLLVKDRFHSSDTSLVFHDVSAISDSISDSGSDTERSSSGERYFLGIDSESGRGYFVWYTDEEIVAQENLRTLRQIGATLSDEEAGLA
ncbi:MAG: hypothetical protein HY050_06215, partial [Actinobacteria bacterium]|nr:hypothetical protein [Actinomycetota bacterium]